MKNKQSLVHFSNPFLVYSSQDKQKKKKKISLSKFVPIKKSSCNKELEIIKWIEDLENNSSIEELLNTVIKPVKIEDKGDIWLQTPVSFPATDRDVVWLKDNLQNMLKQFQAKKYGICFVREEFYFQCFDEIIRQVIINYKKRGLLLSLVRDYFKKILLFYKNLYISSCSFGIQKEIKSEKQKQDIKLEIENLKAQIKERRNDVKNLKNLIEKKKEQFEDDSRQREEAHQQEVKKLQEKKNELKLKLENHLSPKVEQITLQTIFFSQSKNSYKSICIWKTINQQVVIQQEQKISGLGCLQYSAVFLMEYLKSDKSHHQIVEDMTNFYKKCKFLRRILKFPNFFLLLNDLLLLGGKQIVITNRMLLMLSKLLNLFFQIYESAYTVFQLLQIKVTKRNINILRNLYRKNYILKILSSLISAIYSINCLLNSYDLESQLAMDIPTNFKCSDVLKCLKSISQERILINLNIVHSFSNFFKSLHYSKLSEKLFKTKISYFFLSICGFLDCISKLYAISIIQNEKIDPKNRKKILALDLINF